MICLNSDKQNIAFGILAFMALFNLFAINFISPAKLGCTMPLIFNIFMIMLIILGGYLYRKTYVNSFRQKLLQDLLGKTAQDCFVFDMSGQIIFAQSVQKTNSYLELVGFLEKFYKPYFTNDPLLAKMRLSQSASGLLKRSSDNALFFCEHVVISSADFHVVFLKNMTDQFQALGEINDQILRMQQFLQEASFGLVYVDEDDKVIDVNDSALRYMGKMKNEVMNQSAHLLLKGQNTDSEMLLFDDMGCPLNEDNLDQSWNDNGDYVIHRNDTSCQGTVYLIVPNNMPNQTLPCSDASSIPSIIMDELGSIRETNANFKKLFSDVHNFFDALHPNVRVEAQSRIACDDPKPFEIHFSDSDQFATVYVSPTKTKEGDKGHLLQFVDISEQKQLEQQVIQSQKMQAVGQLAGGVAHDFNNLLTAIIGYCDLLLQRFLPNDGAYADLIQIKQNANRAANLVRQLLAFSRQQNLQFTCLNITDVLSEVTALLKRLLGPTINVCIQNGQNIWPVLGDFSQFEQIFINLAVNARDAMNNDGTITIVTSNFNTPCDKRIITDTLPAGDYVCIEVEDTGCGIAPDKIDRIFDPFFSTKEVGAGTGLGLSTVYGIVKQSGGYIDVKSSSLGTTFIIYLPRHEGEVRQDQPKQDMVVDLTGNARILLVEDEDAVRTFTSRALKEKGYVITEAASGDEALDIVKKGNQFDLIICDVVMPKMDGPTLCQHLRTNGCRTKMIFMSGYSEDSFRNNLLQDNNLHFLPKPYNIQDLASKVKTVLG